MYIFLGMQYIFCKCWYIFLPINLYHLIISISSQVKGDDSANLTE